MKMSDVRYQISERSFLFSYVDNCCLRGVREREDLAAKKGLLTIFLLLILLASCTQTPADIKNYADSFYGYQPSEDTVVIVVDKPTKKLADIKIVSKPTPRITKKPLVSSRKKVRFRWPVKGKIISRFGAKKGGLYNDGINIAAPEGATVRASEDGIVVYVGNKLKGYGNLTIIRHINGWLTAYAHKKDSTVKKGDHVKRGQVIGHVGHTGTKKSQLHFAIRKNKTAVDPIKWLAG